jgi:hypothetical protein
VTINTSGLDPKATEVANKLAAVIDRLDVTTLERIEALMDSDGLSNDQRGVGSGQGSEKHVPRR